MQHKPNNQYYQYGSNVIFWLHEAAHCIKKAKRIIIVFTTTIFPYGWRSEEGVEDHESREGVGC